MFRRVETIYNEKSSFQLAWKTSASAFLGPPGCETTSYKKIGFFVDKGTRPLPLLQLNRRGNIDWNNWNW